MHKMLNVNFPKITGKKIWESIFTPKYSFRNMVLSIILGFGLAVATIYIVYGKRATGVLQGLFIGDFLDMPTTGYLFMKLLILAFGALSVGVALRAGLLNIGVSGQATFGAWLAYIAFTKVNQDSNHGLVLLGGFFLCTIGGIIFSIIPGLLRAFFKVNMVVTTIVFNWIATYIVMTKRDPGGSQVFSLGRDADPNNQILLSTYDNIWTMFAIGAVILVVIVFVLWFMQYKTTFGLKTRISGMNENTATYAGYKTKLNIMITFSISGALAGMMGFCMFFLSEKAIPAKESTIQEGFQAIPVALVAMSNPIAIIPSALFFAILIGPVGGISLGGLDSHVVWIFSGVITYFVATIGIWIYFRPILIVRQIFNNHSFLQKNGKNDKKQIIGE